MTADAYTTASGWGRPISVARLRQHTPPQRILRVRYGAGTRPGLTVWLPDTVSGQARAATVLALYLTDRDNLGVKRRPPTAGAALRKQAP